MSFGGNKYEYSYIALLVLPHAKSASLDGISRFRVCTICRDQLYDFFWVSLVQTTVWMFGGISGWFFVIDEILLFFVLVIVKHRLPSPWQG